MRRLLFQHAIAAALVASVAFWMNGAEAAVAATIGAALSWLNLIVHYYVWRPRLSRSEPEKKHIALSVGVIVIKYTLFAMVAYVVAARGWLRLDWFAIGIATILLSALSNAIAESRRKDRTQEIE